jgi:uncharacterized protein
MKARKKRRLLILILLLAGVAIAAAVWLLRKEDQPQVTINGKTWNVELATTQYVQEKGLAERDSLADDAGMLFIYPREKILTFWMKDCLIPLDIAFIDKDMRVINTETMAVEPDGRTRYSSSKPAQFALEVPAGALKRAGVQPGSKVIFSGDIPVPAKADSSP